MELWHRAWTPRYRALTLPLFGLTLVSTFATVASPWLIRWPLLLAALSPRLPFLLVAARTTPTPLFLGVGLVRLCLADPFHYLLGRRIREDGLQRPLPNWLSRRFGRFTRYRTSASFVAIVLRPIGRNLFAAGTLRSHPAAVFLADVLSTAAFLLAVQQGLTLF